MSAYVTGQKAANNQEGVYPDNTADAFDNPRVEYIGELLRRTRGSGFNVGIVTTADVTDSTPAANAAHTSDRFAGAGIAAQFFDERAVERRQRAAGRRRPALHAERAAAASAAMAASWPRSSRRPAISVSTGDGGQGADRRQIGTGQGARPLSSVAPAGGVRQGRSGEIQRRARCGAERRRIATRRCSTTWPGWRSESLAAHSPRGFYLMIEGASIDKRAHASDARTHDLGRHRVRSRRRGGARICEENEQRRGYDERYARDRDRRSRDRRPGARRRRERALRSRSDSAARSGTTPPSSASTRTSS